MPSLGCFVTGEYVIFLVTNLVLQTGSSFPTVNKRSSGSRSADDFAGNRA